MTIGFGRYKGSRVECLPDSYLRWLSTLDDLREPLRGAVDGELRRRRYGDDAADDLVADVGGAPDVEIVEAVLRAGHHSLALRHHPDRGGSTVQMQRINGALQWMRQRCRVGG